MQIETFIDKITLAHMDIPIDAAKVIAQDYETAHQDLGLLLVQAFYRQILQNYPKVTKPVQERALGHAKFFALQRLGGDLKDLIDRATVWLLNEADETGWYRQLEYKDLTELTAALFEQQTDKSSGYYDWKFIVERLIPFAKSMGVPPGPMLASACQIQKIRGSVPFVRELVDQHDAGLIKDESAAEQIFTVINNIANPEVSFSKFQNVLTTLGAETHKRDKPLVGYHYVIDPEFSWLVVQVRGDIELRTIERALNNRVDFHIGSLKGMLTEIDAALNRKKEEDDSEE